MIKLELAKPFVSWAGGKRRLLRQFDKYFPEELINGKIESYFEPFVGAGAVFFHIIQNYNINNAYISDINSDLILAYRVIKKNVDDLINVLFNIDKEYKSLKENDRKEYFYKIRKEYNIQKTNIDYNTYSENGIIRAAQLIFLNKTCFNGLFRVNKNGGFNVSFNKKKNPKILEEKNLKSVSNILQKAEIEVCDFSSIIDKVSKSSFIYYDPPYRPISNTASFTSYSKYCFDDNEQIRFANLFKEIDKIGAKQMLSNSDPKNVNPDDIFFEKLYKDFQINRVMANRTINSNGDKRGKLNELLITNYSTNFYEKEIQYEF